MTCLRRCPILLLAVLGCAPQRPSAPSTRDPAPVPPQVEDEAPEERAPSSEEPPEEVVFEPEGGDPEVFGERRARVPDVGLSSGEAAAALDKDIIRRVVRQHVTAIQACFAAGSREAELGTVALAIEVDGEGAVAAVRVDEEDISKTRVGKCVARETEKWNFTRPEAEPNTIRYSLSVDAS